MRKIILDGGPLDGRTFDVPDGADRVDHHAAVDGWYDGEGRWNPDAHVKLVPDTTKFTAALAEANPALGHTVDSAKLAAEFASNGLGEFLGTGIPRLVREARMGRRVLIVAKTRKRAVELWTEALELATDAYKVARSSGSERITFSTGGVLIPVGLNSKGGRGLAADTLYVDGPDLDLTDLLPCLATSEEPVVLFHEEV